MKRYTKTYKLPLKISGLKERDTIPTPSVVRLNKLANGKLAEFSPLYLGDSTFFFGKTTPDEAQFFYKTDSQTSTIPFRKYFVGTIDEVGDVTNVSPWQMNYQDSLQNYGGACFNANKTQLYLTLCERKFNALECHIYLSKNTKDGWSKPVMLDSKINAEGYTSAQPSLGYDSLKKAEVLYFSSNMPGAKGFDIYYAQYDKAKRNFSNASRCGSKINTSSDEYTPFYSTTENTLYFSTNGKGGFGGQDIFKAKGSMNLWADAEPLPLPINSAADDDYFSIDVKNNRGFFASNRNSESSSNVKTCCDDIYAFYLNQQNTVITQNPFEPSLVLVPLKLQFEYSDSASGDNRLAIYEIAQDVKIPVFNSSLSTLDTTFKLTTDKTYKITASSKSHLTESKEVDLKRATPIDTLYLYPKLIPKKAIVIPGINYEFDSSRLIPESIQKIEEFIYPLLIENPTLIFQINSHTDSKGNDEYNLLLSQRRAASVVQYLTSVKGIEPSRLRSKGFGETIPIAPNSFADGKDNPVGRFLNRRTEFEVVGGVEQFFK
jgi:OOP family OmpA-OmpF porin